jgi:hypothetical protein
MITRLLRCSRVAAFLVCCTALAASPTAAPSDSQNRQGMTVLDYPSPPATLPEMWDKVSVVVRGRITRSDRPTVANGEEAVHRPFELLVIELLRDVSNTVRGRRTLKVILYGGTADINGRLARTVSSMSRVFEVGDCVLLFLGPERADGSFGVVFGDASALWLSESDPESSVSLPHALRRMSAFEGKATIRQDKLLDILRRLPGGR